MPGRQVLLGLLGESTTDGRGGSRKWKGEKERSELRGALAAIRAIPQERGLGYCVEMGISGLSEVLVNR